MRAEKVLSKVIKVTVKTTSVDIPGFPDLVLVDTDTGRAVVMERSAYDNAKTPDDLVGYKCPTNPDIKSTIVISKKDLDELIGNPRQVPGKKYDVRTPGEPLGDDWKIIFQDFSRNRVYYDLAGKMFNLPIVDSYISGNYDIHGIIEKERDNPNVIILPYSSYSNDITNPLYYVEGNGMTLNLGLWLTPELFEEYHKLDYFNRKEFMEKHTILGKYKIEPRYYPSNEEDDEEF